MRNSRHPRANRPLRGRGILPTRPRAPPALTPGPTPAEAECTSPLHLPSAPVGHGLGAGLRGLCSGSVTTRPSCVSPTGPRPSPAARGSERGFPSAAAAFRAVLRPGPSLPSGNLGRSMPKSLRGPAPGQNPRCTSRPDHGQGQGLPWQTSREKRPSPPSLVPSRTGRHCGASRGAAGPPSPAAGPTGLRAQPRQLRLRLLTGPHPEAPLPTAPHPAVPTNSGLFHSSSSQAPPPLPGHLSSRAPCAPWTEHPGRRGWGALPTQPQPALLQCANEGSRAAWLHVSADASTPGSLAPGCGPPSPPSSPTCTRIPAEVPQRQGGGEDSPAALPSPPSQPHYNHEKTALSHVEEGWAERGPRGAGPAFQTAAAHRSPRTVSSESRGPSRRQHPAAPRDRRRGRQEHPFHRDSAAFLNKCFLALRFGVKSRF